MKPKGKMILIGGAINHDYSLNVRDIEMNENMALFETNLFRRILMESKDKYNSRVEIVTTASQIPYETGPKFQSAFECFGARNVGQLHIQTREDAMADQALKRLQDAEVVMFTGGNQLRISSIIGGTEFHDLLLKKFYSENFIYAGTSAGAAAASGMMLYGPEDETLIKGMARITTGLSLLNNIIVDTHFIQRSRVSRLFHAVVSNPRILGLGLSEDSGVIITDGVRMEAIGSGLVILVDARDMKGSNITQVQQGQPLSINSLMVHVMSKYDVYDIEQRHLEIRNIPYIPHILN
jgi:cyanophycinase